jgi:hypothetical protein
MLQSFQSREMIAAVHYFDTFSARVARWIVFKPKIQI